MKWEICKYRKRWFGNIKKEKIKFLFSLAMFFSLVFLAIPLLLKISFFYEMAQFLLEDLGSYKASYFEACGAMIGTFLAVSSAIYIQYKQEEKQKTYDIKKNATIIYWDIKMFYREHDILASRIKDELTLYYAKEQTEEGVIERFLKLREFSGVHIDANWISTVAELICVLGQSTIDDIYWFYGKITNLKKKLEQIDNYNIDDIKTIQRHLYNIGMKGTYYKENEKIKNVLEILDKLIEDDHMQFRE